MSFEEWKECTLGDLVTFQRGHDLAKSAFQNGEFPIAGSNGIIGYHNKFTTTAPCITIGRSGNLGTPYFYEKNIWAHNTTLFVKQFHNSDPKFIYYLLKTLDFKQYNSGSAVPSLNRNYVHPIKVVVPASIKAQHRIGQILTSLDDKIELNRQTNKTLEAIAQALFKEWFVDFNFPSATGEMQESELGELPKGWKFGRLRDTVEVNPRLTIKKGSITKYVEMKDLSHMSMSVEGFIERDFSSGSKFQNGDTLFARITPCLENGKTGFVNFLNGEEIGWGSTEFIVLRGKTVSPFFVYCLSRFERFREFAIKSMVGSSGRQRVVESMLSDYSLVLPSKEILNLFHNKVKPLYEAIKINHEQNKILIQLRDSLLPKLMNGELTGLSTTTD